MSSAHPAIERTVILIKPDAVQRGYIGEIIHRFERKGLQLLGIKMMQLDDRLLEAHYAHHADKDFFADLKSFMKSTPVIAMVWSGPQAIGVVRTMVGPTKGYEAPPGTIRGDFSIASALNMIHASDGPETAVEEVKRFFQADELFAYDKTETRHVHG